MKNFIIIAVGVIGIGCSNTTYLSLTENDNWKVRQGLNVYEKGKNLGAEVIILLFNGKEVEGELLSVRDSALILCTEYAASDEDLANSVYSVILIKNNVINELTLKGSSYVWAGIGLGCLAGGVGGALLVEPDNKSVFKPEFVRLVSSMLGASLGSIAGGITGYALSKEEFILYDIPPNYDFYFLRSLARYEEKEPDYIKTLIKGW